MSTLPQRSAAAPTSSPAPQKHPVDTALENAPWDDEPLTEEDERDLAQARADILNGNVTSQEEFMRQLGL